MNKEYYSKILEAAAARGRGLLIYNLDLRGDYFSGFKLLKRFVMQRTSTLAETIYLFQPIGESGPDVLIRVSVAELNNAQNAKAHLGQELNQSMRPEIPPGTGELETVGDVNFVGRSGPADLTAGISFSRGNICVTVGNAGPKTVDVSELAKQIDDLLRGETVIDEAETEGLRARAVEPSVLSGRAEGRTISVKGRERVTVVPALGELTSQKGWVRISVPDGELNREGNQVVYHSDAAGNVSLRLSVFEGR
jgi:hypothetical protein